MEKGAEVAFPRSGAQGESSKNFEASSPFAGRRKLRNWL